MKKKILCAVFLAALIIPTISWLFLRPALSSENREKREYAAFPELSVSNYTNIAPEFEKWFNDRLPYKNQMTALNAEIKKQTKLESNWMDYIGGLGVIFGKDGWLFYNGNTGESTINDFICNNLYSEAVLEELAAGYQALSDQYKAQGIDFILFIPTNKEQVYPELMPDDLVPQGKVSRTDQLVAYLKEHTDVTVIYAKDALIEAKAEGYPLFNKYDSHWNTVGAFVGSQLICEELTGEKSELSDVTVFYNDAVPEPRDLADVYGLGDEYRENGSWDVYEPEKADLTGGFTTEGASAEAEFMQFESTAEDKREILIIKDSFVFNMIGTMARCFAKLTMISDSKMAKEYVEKYHPSVVILEIVERQFYRAEHQWEELLEK